MLDDKVIITCALLGGETNRSQTPYVPITPQEITDEAVAAYEAGAAVVHIHVRDDAGKNSMDFARFKYVVENVRKRCNIVINLTSACFATSIAERIRPFAELTPELASLDAGTMNWAYKTVFDNTPEFLNAASQKMLETGVKPEIEVFDAGMIDNANYLIKQGFIKQPPYFQFVLGAAGGAPATVKSLVYLVESLPPGAKWSAFGIGRNSLNILYAALALGGNIRVGMEDGIYLKKGVLAKSNAQFVERAVRIVKEFNKEPATPDEAREILGLRK